MVEKRLTNPKIPITLILIAALGAVCFRITTAISLYRNTQNMMLSRDWVEHTQDALFSIQGVEQQTERIESEARYYDATHSPESLSTAQNNALNLQVNILHLKNLVADNSGETPNTQALTTCATNLAQALNSADLAQTRLESLRCRQILSLMKEQENNLLRERSEVSRKRMHLTVGSEVAVVAISLLAAAILFGLMLRDVLTRARIGRELFDTNRRLEESNLELAHMMSTLQRHSHEAAVLGDYRDELQLCGTVAEVCRAAVVRFPLLLPETKGALCIINSSRHTLETIATWGTPAPSLSEVFPPDSCCGLKAGRIRWRSSGESEIECSHFAGSLPEHYVCIPLVAHGDTLGTLFVQFSNATSLRNTRENSGVLHQLVQLTAMAHASLELRMKLENQSIRDSLTGLFNRHFMQVALDRELARAARRKSSLAVFMIDVDHFKNFNDRHSHATGDTVLREVARVLQANVRAEDIVCRYGGEEFTVILPDIPEDIALERATNLRIGVEMLRTEIDEDLYTEITISIGVALFPGHGNTSEALLRQADSALYRAKHEGRNRTCIIREELTQPVLVEHFS